MLWLRRRVLCDRTERATGANRGAGGRPAASNSGAWPYGTPTAPDLSICEDLVPNPYANVEECGKAEFPDALCINRAHEPGPDFDQEFADSLPEASVAVETTRWDYDYGGLGIAFIFGQLDQGAAKFQGLEYHQVVDVLNDPSFADLQFVGHKVHEDVLGTAEILSQLSTFCGATE